jgi:uncharacterized protein HemX
MITVTLTGKIVAIMAIVAILILGFAFRKYKKLTNSILKEQDRQLKNLKKALDLADAAIDVWKKVSEKKEAELEIYRKADEARKLDEKMLLPKSDGDNSIKDLEF